MVFRHASWEKERLIKDLVQGRVYDVPAFSLGREAASSFVTVVLRRSCLRSVGKHRGAAIHSFSWTFVVQNTFRYLIHHQVLTAMPDKAEYLLAINCGSSSIKGKLFAIPSFELLANLAVTNISSSDERVKIKTTWEEGKGKDSEEEADYGDKIRCRSEADVNDFWRG